MQVLASRAPGGVLSFGHVEDAVIRPSIKTSKNSK